MKAEAKELAAGTARVGDYRIIAEIHELEVRILVVRIGHRREVYG